MKLSKQFISRVCVLLLITLSVYVTMKTYNAAASFLFSLMIGVSIILFPILVSFLISLMKNDFFHYTLWTIIIFIGALMIWVQTLPDNRNSKPAKWTIAAMKHFRDKAGILSRYSVAATLTEYRNNYTDSEYYIVKVVYIKGKTEVQNYYLGKVEIDHNCLFKKEIYDIQAISDTRLLKTEFGSIGSLYSNIKLLDSIKGYR